MQQLTDDFVVECAAFVSVVQVVPGVSRSEERRKHPLDGVEDDGNVAVACTLLAAD